MDADKIETLEDGYIVIRTIYKDEGDFVYDLYRHEDEWKHIDKLIALYKKQFEPDSTPEDKEKADEASMELIKKFTPLFKKYLLLFTTGQINFRNTEQRQFVRLFIGDPQLQKALKRKYPGREMAEQITQKFNFLVEGYGHQTEEEIMDDLHVIFFICAKRYKYVGRSFCCYIYNLFKYEVARRVQKYQKNPANFHYKVTTLDDSIKIAVDVGQQLEDHLGENSLGFPDTSWLKGQTCSDIFEDFTFEERVIFMKYYLQDWNDRQIGNFLGMHMNTANQKRKLIVQKLCDKLGYDPEKIKRSRNSGKKAIMNVGI